ncbi:MAG: bifunctional heptose 7-phosphate kinase/heptose 1-phosphate adenyltransferase [Sedimentisphaerales bacterium]|nr:bifunctional heptose 7-phosphate kinase/heptose 1-phosphate adenyltransferase [Sedimentisphaerales bacterium]
MTRNNMYENLLKILNDIGSPEVLVVGDFMLDVYIYGDAEKISPEAPVPVLKISETEYRCGGAGSVAANLTALGAKACCLGIIGDDRDSEILKTKLIEAGANIDSLLQAANRPTTSKQRLIGLAQHLHRQQLIRMDKESTEPFAGDLIESILSAYKDKLPDVDMVCLQDHNKGLLSDSLCREMIRLANQANKKILVDPSLTSDYSKYTGATAITPNRKESSGAARFEVSDSEKAAKAADYLFQKLRLEAIVITLDKEGAYLKTENKCLMIPTRPRSVYDVTGAGDMVLATLAAALASGCDYETAVQLSNITGGIEVEKFGTATVTIQEIADEIAGRNRGISGKIQTIDSLLSELARHRRRKKTIVFTNGCFDVLHRGHIEYLKFCRQQGDIVVLGLNSDNSIRAIKGPGRPINNQDDRAALLAAMEMVDYITLFDEPSVLNLIMKVRPDVLVKGEDWAIKGVVGREFVESYGGKVTLAPLVNGKSSTATIKEMKSLEAKSR